MSPQQTVALSLVVLLAAALRPVSAQAPPGDQPGWSVAGVLHELWRLGLDGAQDLWQDGHAMIDHFSHHVVEDGNAMIDPVGQDGTAAENLGAGGEATAIPVGVQNGTYPNPQTPGNAMIDPVGLIVAQPGHPEVGSEPGGNRD